MQKNGTIFMLILVLLCPVTSAQIFDELETGQVCSYFGESMPENVTMFQSDHEAEEVLRQIVEASGLIQNFRIRAAGVPNAAAVIQGETRYILYDQYFMQDMKKRTGSSWAAKSIMAHEVGHHLNGHTLNDIGSRPKTELEADYYSGFILQRLGANLDDARVAMLNLGSDSGTSTHPARHDRLAAIGNGWMKACDSDPNCRGERVESEQPATLDAVFLAAKTGDLQGLQKALAAGADVNARNEYGQTPLHRAASNKNPAVAALLIDRGADINARDKEGETALHRAASNKNPAVAALLIDRGANIEAQDSDITPLHMAAFSENPDVVALLIDRGADINARDKRGNTPLHLAASNYKNLAVVALLIERGADINARDNRGWTPLHWAAFHIENPDLVALLINHGDDINARDVRDFTPLDIAVKFNNPAIAALLRNRGAR